MNSEKKPYYYGFSAACGRIALWPIFTMPAQFIIQTIDPYYRFIFEGDHQNNILFSRFFRSLPHCKKGIAELAESLKHANRISSVQDALGHFSFVVRDKRALMIAHSATFYSPISRDYAILQLKREALHAPVIETYELNVS